MTADEIVAEHPDLELEDIPAALNYTAEALAERIRSGCPRQVPARREPVAAHLTRAWRDHPMGRSSHMRLARASCSSRLTAAISDASWR
jgi:hypothetical protein